MESGLFPSPRHGLGQDRTRLSTPPRPKHPQIPPKPLQEEPLRALIQPGMLAAPRAGRNFTQKLFNK